MKLNIEFISLILIDPSNNIFNDLYSMVDDNIHSIVGGNTHDIVRGQILRLRNVINEI